MAGTEDLEMLGERFISDLWMRLDETAWHEAGIEIVEEPLWPDPDKEPLPAPEIHQIVQKPKQRAERHKVELFKILTPEMQKKEGDEEGEEEVWLDNKARWILGAKGSQRLKIKFFSRKVGHFEQSLPFEIYGSTRQFPLALAGDC